MGAVKLIRPLVRTRLGRRPLEMLARSHVWAYRLSGGRLGPTLDGAPVLLLTTVGRKTRLPRTVPLVYLPGEQPVLVASNAGLARHPLWYRNLEAEPQALVEVGARRREVVAERLEGAERERAWAQACATFQSYAEYQHAAGRQLPILRLAPRGEGRDFVHEECSREAERRFDYPCDRYVSGVGDAYFRGIDVAAPAETVFRWLCQLRAAPYSYDWIDNFGRPSPRTLTPGLDQLALGQHFMTIFDLVDFEAPRQLTLAVRRLRPLFGDVAVTYLVSEGEPGRSRLTLKIVTASPQPNAERLRRRLLPWLDLPMARKQLRTIKALAERSPA